MLYLAWKHGGENPYCLYHGLNADMRPWDDPQGEPRPPAFPSRLKLMIYGFAAFANEAEAGSSKRKRQQQLQQQRG